MQIYSKDEKKFTKMKSSIDKIKRELVELNTIMRRRLEEIYKEIDNLGKEYGCVEA